MSAAAERDVMVLYPTPARSIAMAICSAGIAYVCFSVWSDGIEYGWVAGSFMALAAAFYAMHLVPGAFSMTLSRQGIEIVDLYAAKRYAWSEVSEFLVRRGILGASVEFHHQRSGAPMPRREKLTELFGYKPNKMAALLNEWRSRAAPVGSAPDGNVWRSRNE